MTMQPIQVQSQTFDQLLSQPSCVHEPWQHCRTSNTHALHLPTTQMLTVLSKHGYSDSSIFRTLFRLYSAGWRRQVALRCWCKHRVTNSNTRSQRCSLQSRLPSYERAAPKHNSGAYGGAPPYHVAWSKQRRFVLQRHPFFCSGGEGRRLSTWFVLCRATGRVATAISKLPHSFPELTYRRTIFLLQKRLGEHHEVEYLDFGYELLLLYPYSCWCLARFITLVNVYDR